ncbi:MAG: hypothetical protein ACK43N_18640 [Pirellulaceae bacterium]
MNPLLTLALSDLGFAQWDLGRFAGKDATLRDQLQMDLTLPEEK